MNWLPNLTFANAILAPALILISVPILLHFFARARARPLPFPSVMFLQKVLRESNRIKRPREWLILILRTLFVTFIILAFLRPVYHGVANLAGHAREKNVILLVDASASMSVADGPQSRFAMACAQASEILSGLSSSDKAAVIWIRSPSRPELPELSANLGGLQEGLRHARVSHEMGDITGAVSMACEMLKDSQASCEAYIISDFQKNNWSAALIQFPSKIQNTLVPIGKKEIGNQALTRLHAQPLQPLAGEEISIHVDVENFSPAAVLRTLHLQSGDIRLKQDVRLSPWGKSSQVFKCKFPKPGEQTLSVNLGEDAFPPDNERWLILKIRESLHVGITGEDENHAAYWTRALNATGWAKTESITASRLPEKLDHDIILLSGWKEKLPQGVEDLLTRGGTVIWYPSLGTPYSLWDDLLKVSAKTPSPSGNIPWKKSEKPMRLKMTDITNPIFSIFSQGAHGDPTRGVIFGRFDLPPLEATMPVIFSYQDGIPALARMRSSSRLYVWNIPLHRELGNWAAQSEFLPFLCEFLLSQRQFSSQDLQGDHPAGQDLSLDWKSGSGENEITLQSSGKKIPLKKQRHEKGSLFISDAELSLGIQEWRHQDRIVQLQAVNFPSLESDLRIISPTEINPGHAASTASATQINRSREGWPLWPLLLGVSLAFIILEIIVLLTFKRA